MHQNIKLTLILIINSILIHKHISNEIHGIYFIYDIVHYTLYNAQNTNVRNISHSLYTIQCTIHN